MTATDWPYPREPAYGTRGMVVSGHPLASGAGLQVLADGGTAVDAALAASGVLAVVRPAWCGPGGDGFALLYTPERGVVALNGSGVSTSSGRSLLLPLSALPKTSAMATLRNDEATYGRSFTYCCSVPPSPAGPRRCRTNPTGSTSSNKATVHRSSLASG